jgi:hypothetical protein
MKKYLFSLILILVIPTVAIAQCLSVGFGGGFSCAKAMTDNPFIYGSERMLWPSRFNEIFNQKPDMGFHIMSFFKIRSSSVPVDLIWGISYTQLYGKSGSVVADSPPWFNTVYTTGALETRRNILTIKTGMQWEIMDSPIAPYISFALLYNIMSETKLTIRNPWGVTEASMEGANRMGLSAGAGVTFTLLPSTDACIEAACSLNNLVGVENGEKKQYLFTISAGLLFSLY